MNKTNNKMKGRIVEKRYADGRSKYYLQYKKGLFWRYIREHLHPDFPVMVYWSYDEAVQHLKHSLATLERMKLEEKLVSKTYTEYEV